MVKAKNDKIIKISRLLSEFKNDKVEDLRDMYLILSRIGKEGIEAIKQVKKTF